MFNQAAEKQPRHFAAAGTVAPMGTLAGKSQTRNTIAAPMAGKKS
jgi:hypothetical protein